MTAIELSNKIQNEINEFENIANEDEALNYCLTTYKTICDELDYDYEFHYIEDIKNNDGAFREIETFIKNHLKI